MNGWKDTELGSLVTYKKGFAFKSDTYDENADVLVVRVSDTTESSINISSCKKISSALANTLNDYALKTNDVIIATVGSWADNPNSVVGKVIKVPSTASGALLNQNAVRLRCIDDLANQDFFYYCLKDNEFSGFLLGNAQGSANQASITLKDIFSYKISLPKIEEQIAIASVLSCLDDKIDLLHRQNITLERMAETLFRQWFVEEAQENWEEVSLLELVELVGGGTPKTTISEYWDGDIPWLSGGDIATNHKGFVTSSEKSITQIGLYNSSAKLLPKFATVISARGTVGKYCLLTESIAFSQSNYGILPKINDCFFFTYLLINHLVEDLQSAAYGSVFDTITTATFRDAKFPNPPMEMVLNFEIYIANIFNKKLINQQQIQTLVKLRDNLLPKLMSGDVKVA